VGGSSPKMRLVRLLLGLITIVALSRESVRGLFPTTSMQAPS